jgi:hypothetical protein
MTLPRFPVLASTAACAAVLFATASAAAEFRFVALGDMPYGDPAEVYPPFEALIAEVNSRAPAFVIHIGDTKSGSTPCSDRMLDEQHAYLNSFAAPVLYTPGDNEWTDCYREAAGGFDPLERLAYIRSTYFADPALSLGQRPVAVDSQALAMADSFAGYPENVRYVHEGVHVITAHVVGSNNNFEPRSPDAVAEFMARDAANVAWLDDSFAAAQAAGAPAVVVAIQADMFEFDFNEFGDETWLRHSGFASFGPALVRNAVAFGKPVLLVFGDSHVFRVLRPFPQTAPNVTALEVFGEADMHAVEVTVDTEDAAVFGYRPLLNPARPFNPS